MTRIEPRAAPPVEQWEPKVGDKAVYWSVSVASGRMAVKRLVEIAEITRHGYIRVHGGITEKFQRCEPKKFVDHRLRSYGMRFWHSYLAPPTAEELATLPKTQAEGREYAKRMQRKSA